MPTNTYTYAARKAAGQCVFDGRRARPGSVMCASCAAKQRRYRARVHAEQQARTAALQARMRQAGMYVVSPPRPAPTPRPSPASAERLLLCCGAWWQITHIPLVVPCCGRVWLQEDPRDA